MMLDVSSLKGYCIGVYLGINQHITRMFSIASTEDNAIENVKKYLDTYVTYEYKIVEINSYDLKEGIVI